MTCTITPENAVTIFSDFRSMYRIYIKRTLNNIHNGTVQYIYVRVLLCVWGSTYIHQHRVDTSKIPFWNAQYILISWCSFICLINYIFFSFCIPGYVYSHAQRSCIRWTKVDRQNESYDVGFPFPRRLFLFKGFAGLLSVTVHCISIRGLLFLSFSDLEKNYNITHEVKLMDNWASNVLSVYSRFNITEPLHTFKVLWWFLADNYVWWVNIRPRIILSRSPTVAMPFDGQEKYREYNNYEGKQASMSARWVMLHICIRINKIAALK